MNNYARLGNVKADQAGTGATVVLDPVLVRAIEQVSREFEQEARRQFHSRTATLVFDGVDDAGTYDGSVSDLFRAPRVSRLWLSEDLLTVSTVKVDLDRDGVFEVTLVQDTDFYLWPANPQPNTPYRALDLSPYSQQLASWPRGIRRVQIAGTWGYSNETEDTGLTGTLSDTSDTTITASADATDLIYPGDTLVIESEQVYVSAVSGTTVTVTRAVNGTTAAAHAAKSLLVRRYPRDVEMAVAERVVGLRWDSQGGYSGMASLAGDMSSGGSNATIRASYARWRRAVERYSLPVVA